MNINSIVQVSQQISKILKKDDLTMNHANRYYRNIVIPILEKTKLKAGKIFI